MMKKILASIAAVCGIAGVASQADAAPIPVELVLAIDASTSISNANYTLQKNAYASVLNSALISTDSTIAIGVIQFASGVVTEFALTVIDSAATKAALVAAVTNMTRGSFGNLTNISGAIDTAVAMLAGLNHANSNEIIDVSTDGFQTVAGNPAASSDTAGGLGIAVNCLGIGGSANCSFNDGEGFDSLVANFADFETALEQKIAQETGVAEPATLMVLGLGLAGVGFAARRRKAA